ncbi:MAG: hypothetical protein E7611_07385 [Ruminococcaceae bacterium]|nr:hypothetical protein [Oscillospiraceae bacterium]
MSRQSENKPQRHNTQQPPKKEISPDAMKRAVILIINTAILTFIYFGSMAINQPILSAIVTVGFWAGFGGLLVFYIFYNRGFSRKGVTEDMLPDNWSKEKKREYIEDGNKRYERSKWMLSVIIPLMIPIALDAISLFTWPIIQNLLGLK